jgi:peptidoglycan-associated lipoprotein
MTPRAAFHFLFICTIFLAACSVTQQVKNGDTLYKEKQYTVAAGVLKKEFDAAADRPTRARKAFLIAECYRNAGQNAEAEPWYKQAHDLGYDDRALYLDGMMLKSEEKYTEALAAFNEYLQDQPYDEDARNQIEGCNLALEWQANPAPVVVKNLQEINSSAFDYAPAIYENNALVFSSDRGNATGEKIYGWTGEKFSDLFIANKSANGSFSEPAPFEAFNTPYNEGAACFSADGEECYFTRCGGNNANENYCRIFYSQRQGEAWSNPEALNIFYDSCNVSQPGLSKDGKQLFFSSDADGGYGGKDLYVITKTGN